MDLWGFISSSCGEKGIVEDSIRTEMRVIQSSNYCEDKYKTEECETFQKNGMCEYSVFCMYSHSSWEKRLRFRDFSYKKKKCKNESCSYGTRCCYRHKNEEEVGRVSQIPPCLGKIRKELMIQYSKDFFQHGTPLSAFFKFLSHQSVSERNLVLLPVIENWDVVSFEDVTVICQDLKKTSWETISCQGSPFFDNYYRGSFGYGNNVIRYHGYHQYHDEEEEEDHYHTSTPVSYYYRNPNIVHHGGHTNHQAVNNPQSENPRSENPRSENHRTTGNGPNNEDTQLRGSESSRTFYTFIGSTNTNLRPVFQNFETGQRFFFVETAVNVGRWMNKRYGN